MVQFSSLSITDVSGRKCGGKKFFW